MEAEILVAALAAVGLMGAGALVWAYRRWRRPSHEGGAPAAAGVQPANLASALGKTRSGLLDRLRSLAGREQPDARLAELEEALLAADVGIKATERLIARLRSAGSSKETTEEFRQRLSAEMVAVLEEPAPPPEDGKPHVVVVVGVNGVGKTTTIGKLAHRYRASGKKVLLVAADTFRAAAADQLATWAERTGSDFVRHQDGADPSAVAHDGMAAGISRGVDVVIVDTAGRLHVKKQLIEELRKLVRVIGRVHPGAPHEVLLVLDAGTGQNALAQARVFQEAVAITGIVLTKVDGTAKGGVVFAIRSELGVPVRYLGLGEGLDDLRPFDAREFVAALLAEPSGS
jgi:fused signal recognition particle receptor